MKCPRCKSRLETKIYGDLELDQCPDCHGVWFDQGELSEAKDTVAPDLQWLEFDFWKHPEKFKLSSRPMACPRCSAELFAINYENTPIEVDVCTHCRGVWLDDGEFEKIIDALNQELATADVSDYVKASVQEGKEIFTGDDKLKAEWKDFTTVLRLMQYRIFTEKPRLLRELLDAQKGTPIW